MIVAMLVVSSMSQVKAISASYGMRGNRGGQAMLRTKRQTHPATTVARFTERPEVVGFVPEPIDHLTPPRPPDPITGDRQSPISVTDAPVLIPSEVPTDPQQDTKWKLNYEASDILSPPSDPLSLINDNVYATIKHIVLRTEAGANDNRSPSLVNDNVEVFTRSNDDELDPTTAFSNEQHTVDVAHRFTDPFQVHNHRFFKRHINRPKRMSIYYDDQDEDAQDQPGNEEDHQQVDDDRDQDDDDHHKKKKAGHVYTFVKTDKHGHFKWGVRQHGGLF